MSQVQVNSMNLMMTKFGLGYLVVKEKKDGTKKKFF